MKTILLILSAFCAFTTLAHADIGSKIQERGISADDVNARMQKLQDRRARAAQNGASQERLQKIDRKIANTQRAQNYFNSGSSSSGSASVRPSKQGLRGQMMNHRSRRK